MKINCFYHAEEPHVALCIECGRPLCEECVRSVRGTVYCEQCLGAVVEGKNGKIVSIRDRFRRDEGERREEPQESLVQRDSDVPARGFEGEGPSLVEIIEKRGGRRRGWWSPKSNIAKVGGPLVIVFLVGVIFAVATRWGEESGEQEADRREAAEGPAAPKSEADEGPKTASDCTMKVQIGSAPFLRIPLPPGGCDIRNALVAPVVIRLDAAGERGEFVGAPRGPMFKIVGGEEVPGSWKVLEGASEIWVRAKEEAFLFRLAPPEVAPGK